MPRRRPRQGRSDADPDAWEQDPPPAATPTKSFSLDYRDALPGYAVVSSEVPLNGTPLTALLATRSTVVVRGWEGLAQPQTITCTKTGAGALPKDFTCTYTHSHRRWERIDDNGKPTGHVQGDHTHTFSLHELWLAEYEQNDPPTVQWYAIHRH